MKKGWIIALIIFGTSLLFIQSHSALAQYNDTRNCNNNDRETGWNRLYWSWDRQEHIEECIADQDNSRDWCCVCFENNPPSICSQLHDALSGTPTQPVPTSSPYPTPTNIPTPTPRPVNCVLSNWSTCSAPCGMGTQTRSIITPAQYGGTCYGPFIQDCYIIRNCPVDCVWGPWSTCSKSCDQGIQTRSILTRAAYGGKDCTGSTQTTCFIQSCSAIGTTGGFTSGTTGTASNELQIYLKSYTANAATAAKTLLPTYTPIPTKAQAPTITPSPTPIPQEENQFGTPQPTNTPYVRPTTAPLPTPKPTAKPVPVPTERLIPPSLTTKTETTKDKTTSQLDIKSLTEIKVVPNTPPKVVPTDKPFLPQEQRQLAIEAPAAVAGLLVTLEQKVGSAFVTQQDELLVKRGNQFFSISNQITSTETQKKQSGQTQSSAGAPAQLEINANNVIARSSMGLSVDPLSGILTVETPNGPQKVSIMPDEALGIVLELKALNSKGVIEPTILLVSEKGSLIYRISGERVEKFLGFFPLSVQKQIVISADTGSVIKVELSLFAQVLSLFTF